jgi:hypothetical protein
VADDLRTRGVNLALGTWRDAALHDLKQARRHINAALEAANAGDPQTAAHEASRAVTDSSTAWAELCGWRGAADIARLVEEDER